MRKGNKCMYNGQLYEIWRKEKQHVIIYNPVAAFPELTMQAVPAKDVKKI